MAQGFRIVIEAPRTQVAAARTIEWTEDSGVVQQVLNELKADDKTISYLTVRIADPGWSWFNALPDPAFADIPFKFYLSPAGNPNGVGVSVFEGKVTSLSAGFPGPEQLTIIGQDRSFDMRIRRRQQVFRAKSSTQIAEALATQYGLSVDIDQGDVQLVTRSSSFAPMATDWEHLRCALAADGLRCWVEGRELRIRQNASRDFGGQPFRRGKPPVVRLEVRVNHVGMGGDGNTKVRQPFEDKTTTQAALASKTTQQKEAQKAGTENITHRAPLSAPASSARGSHAENVDGAKIENQATGKRRRKDAASLTLQATPELRPEHRIELSGWGERADGVWYVEAVRHVILDDGAASSTTAALTRGPSKKAAREQALPFQT